MINQAGTDQLDDAIDVFEETWSVKNAPSRMRSLLERYGLEDDVAALTELIRIDIELRYKGGHPIQLDEYFCEFNSLLAEPQHVAQIAFEDFRSRSAHGHPVSCARWHELPGVREEIWFQELSRPGDAVPPRARSRSPLSGGLVEPATLAERIADAEFESALESIGFRIIQQIGQGAFSHVYLATQNDLANRYVVLKVVQKSLAEPENMAMLQHTNIVPIYSFHRIQSRSVICMPYAGDLTLGDYLSADDSSSRGGQSLLQTVRNRVDDTVIDSQHGRSNPDLSTSAAGDSSVLKPLEHLREFGCNDLALWLFERLAAALAHSHARGMLHGDLKPANVLIRNDGEPALLDFNLAQSLDRNHLKHVGGTLPYMAPESYRALMGQAVTPRAESDIYGLGVMIFEFVTGRMPYPSARSSAPIDLEPAITARRSAPDWKANDQVSPGLRSIINRCLAFEHTDRYESADHLQEDLANELSNRSLKHAPEPARSKFAKWMRRHPRWVSGSSVGAMLLVLLIPLAVTAKVRHDRSQQLTAMASVNAFADRSADALSISVANPRRHSEEMIDDAFKPLQEFGILDATRQNEILSPYLSKEQAANHRETASRHVLHVAFIELGYLRSRFEASVAEDSLARLDSLIAAAERILDGTPSRALAFAKAERSALIGDAKSDQSIRQADAMEIQNDSESYLEAIRLLSNRKYDDARNRLSQLAVSSSIPSALVWTLLGRSQYSIEDYASAKLSFTKSIEHAPNASRLYLLRGICFAREGQFEEAIQDYDDAIEHEPGLVNAYTNRALAHFRLGDDQQCLADANRAIERRPNEISAILLRSRVYKRLGENEKAEKDFQAAMEATDLSYIDLITRYRAFRRRANELDPQYDPKSINREQAQIYRRKALADLQLAKRADRSQEIVHSYSAIVLTDMGRLEEAIDEYTVFIDENRTETALAARALLYARLKRYDEAYQGLKDARSLGPNRREVLYLAACINALLPEPRGNPQRALNLLSKSLQSGYGAHYLVDDPDLESLRDLEGFRALVRTVELGRDLNGDRNQSDNQNAP